MRVTGIKQASHHHGPRRGVVMVMMLACLMVITLLLSLNLRSTMNWRRQVRYETWNAQARWIAESGLNRAVWRLSQNADYAGETWEPDDSDGPARGAKVDINVDKRTNKRVVRVVVEFAEASGRPIRVRRELQLGG